MPWGFWLFYMCWPTLIFRGNSTKYLQIRKRLIVVFIFKGAPLEICVFDHSGCILVIRNSLAGLILRQVLVSRDAAEPWLRSAVLTVLLPSEIWWIAAAGLQGPAHQRGHAGEGCVWRGLPDPGAQWESHCQQLWEVHHSRQRYWDQKHLPKHLLWLLGINFILI